MGDRRNVIVQHSNGLDVALYSHWGGSELQETVADALVRGAARWTDETYLTRIIFSEMIKREVMDETGYGIEPIARGATNYCEASPGYDLIVNIPEQTVYDGDGSEMTFTDFTRQYTVAKITSL